MSYDGSEFPVILNISHMDTIFLMIWSLWKVKNKAFSWQQLNLFPNHLVYDCQS